MEKYISAIIFTVIGAVILIAAALTMPQTIAAFVIGGLFLGAGIMCFVNETFINKKKK